MSRLRKPTGLDDSAGKNIRVGSKVVIPSTNKKGILRFLGETSFKPGIWAGIEISTPEGKNDGSVQGISYFSCKPNHGVFIASNKIALVQSSPQNSPKSSTPNSSRTSSQISPKSSTIASPKSLSTSKRQVPDLTPVRSTAKRNVGTTSVTKTTPSRSSRITPSSQTQAKITGPEFLVDETVVVGEDLQGIVKFVGKTQFAEGVWYGIVLPTASGKNNGTVKGVAYFEAQENHGLFCRVNNLKKMPQPILPTVVPPVPVVKAEGNTSVETGSSKGILQSTPADDKSVSSIDLSEATPSQAANSQNIEDIEELTKSLLFEKKKNELNELDHKKQLQLIKSKAIESQEKLNAYSKKLIDEYKLKNEDLQTEIQSLKSESEKNNEIYEAQQHRVNEEIKQMKQDLALANSGQEDQNEKEKLHQQLETEVHHWAQQYEKKEKDLEATLIELAQSKESTQNLNAQVAELARTVEELSSVKIEYDGIKAEKIEVESKLEHLEKSIEADQEEQKTKEENLLKQVKDLREKLENETASQLRLTEEKTQAAEANMQQAEAKVKEAEAKIADFIKYQQELEDNVHRLIQENKKMKQSLTSVLDTSESNEATDRKIADLEKELEDSRQNHVKLEEQITSLSSLNLEVAQQQQQQQQQHTKEKKLILEKTAELEIELNSLKLSLEGAQREKVASEGKGQDSIMALERDLESSEQSLNIIEKELKEKMNELNQSQERANEFQKQITSLTSSLKEKEACMDEIKRNEQEQLANQASVFDKEMQILRDSLSSNQKELDDKINIIGILEDKTNKLGEETLVLKNNLQSMEQKNMEESQARAAESNTSSTIVNDLTGALKEKEKELASFRAESQELASRLQLKTDELSIQGKEIEKLKEDGNHFRIREQDTQRTLENLQLDLEKEKQEMAKERYLENGKLKAQLQQSELQNMEQVQEKESLLQQLQEKEQEKKSLFQQISSTEKEKENLVKDFKERESRLQEQLQTLQPQLKDKELANKKHRDLALNLEKDVRISEQTISKLNKSVVALEDELKNKTSELMQTKEKEDQLQILINSKENGIKNLEGTNQSLLQKITSLQQIQTDAMAKHDIDIAVLNKQLETKYSNENEIVNSLQQELASCREQVSIKTQELAQIKIDKDAFRARAQQFSAQAREKIKGLTAQMEHYKTESKTQEEEKIEVEKQNTQFSEALVEQKQLLNTLKEELQNERLKASGALGNSARQIEELNEQLEENKSVSQLFKQKEEAAQLQIDNLQETVKTLEESCSGFEKVKNELSAQVLKGHSDFERIRGESQEAASQMQQRLDSLQADHDKLQYRLSVTLQENKALQETQEVASKNSEAVESQVEEINGKLESKIKELNELKKENDRFASQLETVSQELAASQNEVSEVSGLKEHVATLTQAHEALVTTNKEINAELVNQSKLYEIEQQKTKQHEATISEFEGSYQQLASLSKENSDLTKEIQALNTSFDKYRQTYGQIEIDLKKKCEEVEVLNENQTQLRSQVDSQHEKVADETNQLRSQLSDLNSQLVILKNEKGELINEIDSLNERHRTTQNEQKIQFETLQNQHRVLQQTAEIGLRSQLKDVNNQLTVLSKDKAELNDQIIKLTELHEKQMQTSENERKTQLESLENKLADLTNAFEIQKMDLETQNKNTTQAFEDFKLQARTKESDLLNISTKNQRERDQLETEISSLLQDKKLLSEKLSMATAAAAVANSSAKEIEKEALIQSLEQQCQQLKEMMREDKALADERLKQINQSLQQRESALVTKETEHSQILQQLNSDIQAYNNKIAELENQLSHVEANANANKSGSQNDSYAEINRLNELLQKKEHYIEWQDSMLADLQSGGGDMNGNIDHPVDIPDEKIVTSSSRPYCENCEAFGHDTEDCDAEEEW